MVPGSTLKGVLRTNCEDEELRKHVFGPETENASAFAGSAQFFDLRLLFLPVRSFSGTFAWVTSPLLLRRFQRDCAMAHTPFPAQIPLVNDKEICLVPSTDSQLTLALAGQEENQVVLEDLRLAGQADTALAEVVNWLKISLFAADTTWQTLFAERVCVVHDDVLSFLLETATEITARIRLDEAKKTVKQGALWYEEALPAESILSGLLVIQAVAASEADVLETITQLTQNPLQVGGSTTVGRGLCRVHLA